MSIEFFVCYDGVALVFDGVVLGVFTADSVFEMTCVLAQARLMCGMVPEA